MLNVHLAFRWPNILFHTIDTDITSSLLCRPTGWYTTRLSLFADTEYNFTILYRVSFWRDPSLIGDLSHMNYSTRTFYVHLFIRAQSIIYVIQRVPTYTHFLPISEMSSCLSKSSRYALQRTCAADAGMLLLRLLLLFAHLCTVGGCCIVIAGEIRARAAARRTYGQHTGMTYASFVVGCCCLHSVAAPLFNDFNSLRRHTVTKLIYRFHTYVRLNVL